MLAQISDGTTCKVAHLLPRRSLKIDCSFLLILPNVAESEQSVIATQILVCYAQPSQ